MQGSTLDQKSQFRMMVATFDQEQERAWNDEDFDIWVSGHSQLRRMCQGWNFADLFDVIRNEGLFMCESGSEYGRASPALFEIVTVLEVCVYFF